MKFQIVLGLTVLLVLGVTCEEKTTEESTGACTPGEEFSIGCNTCVCPDSGKKDGSACTLKLCPDDESIPTLPSVPEKCEPGSTYSVDDCNTCTCPESGVKSEAACTAIACESKQV